MKITATHGAHDDFSAAFDEHKDEIFRHCYFIVFDRDIALEIMQDAFMKTWEYVADGNDIDNIRAFLYRTASNLCFNYKRKKHESSLDALQEEGYDPPSEDEKLKRDIVEEERVMSVLKQIDEPYRSAVSMRYIQGLSPAEIADIVGESANTVSVRITRGIKQLRTLLPDG
ncbi:MAG TPA: RNA polymerase sigma factor [Candidatus Peribacteraceae bacterium]|nr:RNA polymerase sigma factor [Candidatus Peribacteraceae bacterium]